MNHALTISGLTKTYPDFVLDHVSFTVPSGSIVGLIGENGAGKSTTIHAAIGLIQKEADHAAILGKEELDAETREQIGVVFGGSNYPEILSPKKISRVMKHIYRSWDEPAYLRLLKQFSLPPDKPIRQFSKGMKMKLAITAALSHHSKLLILDEATSGLDPVIRDDILDMLLDFVQDEEHSILISSHITSDLEKVADYIVFIHEGKVVTMPLTKGQFIGEKFIFYILLAALGLSTALIPCTFLSFFDRVHHILTLSAYDRIKTAPGQFRKDTIPGAFFFSNY